MMRVSRVTIENYRNLRHVDVNLDSLVALVGENNSGKSNFLRAISLPLSLEDGGSSKRLSWYDINNDAKAGYYEFIESHAIELANGNVTTEDLSKHIPSVSVAVDILSSDTEHYDVKDILVHAAGEEFVGRIQYRWFVGEPQKLLDRITALLFPDSTVQEIKLSLLPMDLFRYEIVTIDDAGERKVPYDVLSRFKYALLPAERDNFASSTDRLGSRALVGLLQEKLDPTNERDIEQEYGRFLDTIRKSAQLDKVINWQDYSDAVNAKDFFDEISVLPNVPAMTSILGSIRLGYGDESLAFQGLGHRNLILMAVMLNSYLNSIHDISLMVVGVEEPEAHLCVNKTLLMASLFKAFGDKDSRTQLIYTTHNNEFVNKVGLDKVVVLHGGNALSLKDELEAEELDYLSNNPNMDIFSLLFSHRLVLVEGITEELLIKAYLQARHELNDIKVLSFHKGYRDIIGIWKKVNAGNGNRLGIVRDFDNQPAAQAAHEALADSQVCVKTTTGYTLETDIVATGENHRLLVERYGAEYGWANMTDDELEHDWREHRKTDVMVRLSHDLADGEMSDFVMPKHIREVLEFVSSPLGSQSAQQQSANEN